MSVDSIGDFLTVIRNGLKVAKRTVRAPHSRMKEEILVVLKDEGYIRDYSVQQNEAKKEIEVVLKYVQGESVIHNLDRVSTPGCRRYKAIKDVKPVIGGLGIAVLSTNRGVMSDRRARELHVGGEVICQVW